MACDTLTGPLLDDPKQLLLDMAQQRALPALLQLIVQRHAASPRVALARIWLKAPGDICPSCPMRLECPDQSECLHLVASAGTPQHAAPEVWERLTGRFRRFPLQVRKVGCIASTGEPLEIPDVHAAMSWIADPEWVQREGIVGFAGQPLMHGQQVLGVLGVFARTRLSDNCLAWLRMIANHTAVSIANTRAFAEIEALRQRLELENAYLREEVQATQSFGQLVGSSPALAALVRQIDLVAATDATVLVLGESGSGKEVVARELHQRSARAQRPLVKVNCAAISRELYESEFFGHVKGAFTGALRDRVGRFELADGGTLFLDEIGEIPLDLQSKLLRVLQEGELERLGEERTRHINVRLITATNRDLQQEVAAGRFRQDLYYRLHVFPLRVPPLRERRADIPALTEHFLTHVCRRLGRVTPRLTGTDIQTLQAYDWPGNVRELQHVIERAVILAPHGRLTWDLPQGLGHPAAPATRQTLVLPETGQGVLTEAEIRQFERHNLVRALHLTQGKIYGPHGAAALLGMKATTLASRLKALGIPGQAEARS